MGKRKTPEQYLQECKERGVDLPTEDYKNATTKIKHKCSKGHIYLSRPSDHLRGQGCQVCAGNTKKTPEQYFQECKDRDLDLPIEDYKNNSTPIKHKCKNGHIYLSRPSDHLRGVGCSYCYGNAKKYPKQYLKECKDKGYDLPIEDYKSADTPIKHKCKNGHIYLSRPSDHLRGTGCKKCADNNMKYIRRKTSTKYIQECTRDGYDLPIQSYQTKDIKIEHKCKKGHIYEQTPHSHLQNYGCPICKESHGERFIRNYLDKNNIKYESQKTFNDLKDKDRLSYDFYLPGYNILIEYQGIQHYEPSEYFGGEEQFKLQQLHDKLKRDYAKDNGYKMLELKYTLDNQELVDKYLKRRIK